MSRTRAGLVDIPPIERILIGWICVDGNEERSVRIVKDVLGAIAVVVVDIEDGDASVRGECRGSQRGIVEIAIATKIIAAGVVTGRPTEGIGGCGAVEQTGRACACSAGGGECCAPTTGSEWCGVETIITGLDPEGRRTLASAAQRESRRRQFG